MVAKRIVAVIMALILIQFIPMGLNSAQTRNPQTYTLENMPEPGENGNYTLDGEDEWHLLDEGAIVGNITLLGNSIILIQDASINITGNVWVKDNAEIIISSSFVKVTIPTSAPVIIEEQYDNPNGFMLIEDDASLKIADSTLHLFRHARTEDMTSVPQGMMIPMEVMVNFGNLYIRDSTLNTTGSISIGTTNITAIRGIVMHGSCEFNFLDSDLTSGIVFYVNSRGLIERTRFRSISGQKTTNYCNILISDCTMTYTVSIDQATNLIFRDCVIESCLFVKDMAVVYLQNTTIAGLQMSENGTLNMDGSFLPVVPTKSWWYESRDNIKLNLYNNSRIETMVMHDNSSLTLVDSSMNSTQMYGNTFAKLADSSIQNLTASHNATVWISGSDFDIHHLHDNASIRNVTNLKIETHLNGNPVSLPVTVRNLVGDGEMVMETDERGTGEMVFARDMLSVDLNSGETSYQILISNLTLSADFEKLHSEVEVEIQEDLAFAELVFEDYTPPEISDLSFEADPFFNTEEKVPVSVRVTDEHTNLAYVILRYSTDDGKTWDNITMYNTGQQMYSNAIPGQDDGTKVRFFIMAADNTGNVMRSKYLAYTVGEDVVLVNDIIIVTGLILITGILVIMVFRSWLHGRRRKRYADGFEKEQVTVKEGG